MVFSRAGRSAAKKEPTDRLIPRLQWITEGKNSISKINYLKSPATECFVLMVCKKNFLQPTKSGYRNEKLTFLLVRFGVGKIIRR